MAQTVSNVTAGKPAVGGALYRAPKGTTIPTNAYSTLTSAYVSLGYCSEEGMKNNNSGESSETKAWGGDPVLNVQTGKVDTFNVTLIEALNPNVLATVHGESNVSGTLSTGITVTATTDDYTEYVYVCDMIMRDGALKRIVIPDGKITAVGEIVYNDSTPVGYPLTITAFATTINNKIATHQEHIYKASASSGSSS